MPPAASAFQCSDISIPLISSVWAVGIVKHEIAYDRQELPRKSTVHKALTPREHVSSETSARQGTGAAVSSPRSAYIAQLERAIRNSEQAESHRELAALIDASPVAVAQRKLEHAITNSPKQAAQRRATHRAEGAPKPEAAARSATPDATAPVQRVTAGEIARGTLMSIGIGLSLGIPVIYKLLRKGEIYTCLWLLQFIKQKNLHHSLTHLAQVAAAVPALSPAEILDLGEVHAGAGVADLTQIGQSANRTLDERITLANGAPALTGAEVHALAGVHPGINGPGLIHIAQSANRTLADRIALATGVPALSAQQVDQLAGVHGGVTLPGLLQIGQSANRSLAERIAITAAVAALTGAEVDQLAGVHGGIDLAGLTLIGLSADRSLAERIAVANAVVALTGQEVCQLAAVHNGVDAAGLVHMGLSPNRTLADRIAIATGAIALSGQQVSQLAGVHGGINVAGLIRIGQPAVRPLDSRIAAANAFPTLTAGEIVKIGLVAVAADLSNTIIDNILPLTDLVIHAASSPERQAVLANRGLLAIVKTLGHAPVLMSALLEGSQKWRNPTKNYFYKYFVSKNRNGRLPNKKSMNCWESVLYAFYLAGRKTAADIRSFYGAVNVAMNPNAMVWQLLGFHLGLTHYDEGVTTPAAGQVLFYLPQGRAVPSHVALSLGGDHAQSLWHSPNAIDSVQRIQVNDLHTVNDTIYFGNLA
jgi:hypothetical protein